MEEETRCVLFLLSHLSLVNEQDQKHTHSNQIARAVERKCVQWGVLVVQEVVHLLF